MIAGSAIGLLSRARAHYLQPMRRRLSGLCWILAAAALVGGCTHASVQTPTRAPSRTVDYAAMETAIDEQISSGSATLDSIQGVLVSVDGQTVIANYQTGLLPPRPAARVVGDQECGGRVCSICNIAISDGLIENLDQTLSQLLPKYRKEMERSVSAITLRQLMSMTAGIDEGDRSTETVKDFYARRGDFVKHVLHSDLISLIRVPSSTTRTPAAISSSQFSRLRCSATAATSQCWTMPGRRSSIRWGSTRGLLTSSRPG